MPEPYKLTLSFDDPRLHMSVFGRFLVRFSFYVGYFVVTVFTFLLLLSDVSAPTFWLGIFFTLFIIDRVFHIGEGEDSIHFMPKGGKYNLARLLTPKSFAILEAAYDRALLSGKDVRFILLAKLLDRKDIETAIERLEIKKDEFLAQAEREFERSPLPKEEVLSFISRLVFKAFEESYRHKADFIEPKDLFAGLSALSDKSLDRLFMIFSINRSDVSTSVIFTRARHGFFSRLFHPREASGAYPFHIRHRVMNRAWTARPTPFLDQFSEDFTDLARAGSTGFLIGHEGEYDRLLDVLSRPTRPIALLVGEPGVGKDALIHHLAYNIVKDNVPDPLFDKRLVALSVGRLVAGAEGGELQGRVMRVMQEIVAAGNIILYVPDIDNLAKGSGATLTVADILVPLIRRGAFPVIGATYPREFKKTIEPVTDFASTFEIIRVEEVSEAEAAKILTFMSAAFEKEYKVTVTLGAVKKAVVLAHKYFRQKPLPVSAEELLKEALAEAMRLKEKVLNIEFVIRVAERKVNIPLHQFDAKEAALLLNLEERIHKRFIDQEEAVRAVGRALREYRSGLSRKGGPIASFLFVGPTGVGKTELSKLTAEIQFGSVELMTRFDMSEYQDKMSFYRFIGSPDGTINGALTDAILQKPYSLILLDEFEKAHPDILNLFLQVFDDGRLTDNLGRIADFQNSVIIATSNAHSEFIQQSLDEGKEMAVIAEEVKRHLTRYFKPELINRFSDIVIFKSLSSEDTKKIAAIQLRTLANDLAEAHNITLSYDDAVVARTAELGYSRAYGARPLRRVISEKLRGVIAEKILAGGVRRNDLLRVAVDNGEFVFYNSNTR